MTENILRQAAGIIGTTLDVAKEHCREVEGLNAWYFWSPERGGKAVIIDERGEVLAATSSIGFETHLEEFKKGRRN